MAIIKLLAGSIATIASTELNSLANNARALGAEYDNSSNLMLSAGFELNVTFGTAPTADATVDLYLIPALDGTNYGDGSSSVAPPANCYVGSFPVRAVTTAQRIPLRTGGVLKPVDLLPVKYKPIIHNNATGQAFPSSGSTLKISPFQLQSV